MDLEEDLNTNNETYSDFNVLNNFLNKLKNYFQLVLIGIRYAVLK